MSSFFWLLLLLHFSLPFATFSLWAYAWSVARWWVLIISALEEMSEEYLSLGTGECLPFYCSAHQGASPEQCKIHLVPPVSLEFIFWELHETFHILVVARLNLNFELVIRVESFCNEPLNTCWGEGLDHCPKILNTTEITVLCNWDLKHYPETWSSFEEYLPQVLPTCDAPVP